MNKAEAEFAIQQSVKIVAQAMGVKDWDWLTEHELLPLIRAADSQTADLLDDFRSAYREWFDYAKKLEKKDREPKAAETQEFIGLNNAREAARHALVRRTAELRARSS
jgi:hypothetical protein